MQFLVDMEMAKDEPGMIHEEFCLSFSEFIIVMLNTTYNSHLFVNDFADGIEAELSLVHPHDVDWFITLNKTHHELMTQSNTMTICYVNASFARSGDCLVETSSHTTGFYGFMFQGETPTFIHPQFKCYEQGELYV
jgi:hypothetical protein